jgi:hypothetical protein
VDNPQGHCGRHTFTSGALNSDCDTSVVALSTKHRSPQVMQGYQHVSSEIQMKPVMCMVSKNRENKSKKVRYESLTSGSSGVVVEDEDDFEDDSDSGEFVITIGKKKKK